MKKVWRISAVLLFAGILFGAAGCKVEAVDATVSDQTAPKDVASFAVTAANGNAVLTWEEPEDDDYAGVQLSVNPAAGTLSKPLCTTKGVTSLEVTGLKIGGTYTFTAKSFDTSHNYSEGQTFEVTVADTTDYDAPANVEITDIDAKNGNAQITWKNPDDKDFAGVQISVSPAAGTLASPVSVSGDTTTLFVSGLTVNKEYTFTLKSYDKNLNYAEGVTKTVTVADTADYTAPGKVKNLKVIAADGTAVITWTNSGDADLEGLKISANPAEGTLSNYVMLDKNAASFECGGLTIGKEYTFYVKAYDTSYNQGENESVTVKVADTKDYSAPADVTGINIVASNGEAIVTWTNPEDTDFAGTKITMTPAEGTMANAVYFDSSVSSLKVAGLELNKEYSFKIQTYDTSLNYSEGSTKTAAVADNNDYTAPANVETIDVDAKNGNAKITWTNPEDEDFAGVQVSVSPAEGTLANPVCVYREVTTLFVSGLAIGQEYTFTLKSYDTNLNYSEGTSKTVNVVNTADYDAPGKVKSLKVTAADGTAVITWTNPADDDLKGLKISANPADGSLSNYVMLDKNVTSFECGGLTIDKEYTFYVKAYDTSYNEGEAESVTVTVADTKDYTAPAEVTNLQAECVDGVMKLSWTNPTDTDFYCVKITAAPAEGTFANPVYLTSGNSFETSDLTDGTAYTFTLTTFDSSLNESDGVSSDSVTFAADYEFTTSAVASKINHYLQNANDNCYTLDQTETKTVARGTEISAIAKEYACFTVRGMSENIGEINVYYDRNIITVKFLINADDTQAWVTRSGRYGANIAAVADPTKADKGCYHFNYWTTDGSTEVTPVTVYPLENITYIANWHKIVSYSVTYTTEHGTAPETKYIDCHTKIDDTYFADMDNVDEDNTTYEFNYWIDDDTNKRVIGNRELTEDLNLTAKWHDINAYNWYEEPIDATTGKLATSSSTYVYFGVFPKTVLPEDSTVTINTNIYVTMGGNKYYLGSDNEYYAKITENCYNSSYTYSDGTTVQMKSAKTTRYFKLEPIKWKLISTEYEVNETEQNNKKCLLITDEVVDSGVIYGPVSTKELTWKMPVSTPGGTQYADVTVDPASFDYKTCNMRAYLNGSSDSKGFLQKAFTENAQKNILTKNIVIESYTSTSFYVNSGELNDKIFLIDEDEFNTYSTDILKKNVSPNDYVKANYYNYGTYDAWWIRRVSTSENKPYYINSSGNLATTSNTQSGIGIRPAICVDLE